MANDRYSKGEAIKFGWEAMAHAYVYRRLEYGTTSVQMPQVPETAPSPEA